MASTASLRHRSSRGFLSTTWLLVTPPCCSDVVLRALPSYAQPDAGLPAAVQAARVHFADSVVNLLAELDDHIPAGLSKHFVLSRLPVAVELIFTDQLHRVFDNPCHDVVFHWYPAPDPLLEGET